MLPASLAVLIGMGSMAAVFAYLHSVYRERHLRFWMTACAALMCRYLALAAQALWGRNDLLSAGYYASTVIGGLYMLWGAQLMAGKERSRGLGWSVPLGALWALGAPLAGLTPQAVSTPVFLFLGGANLFAGRVILGSRPKPRPRIVTITSYLFMGWGLHQLDYPLLRFVPWFAPLGYLVGNTFALACSLGVIFCYFERYRQEVTAGREHFKTLFQSSPVPVIEEDFSAFKQALDGLKAQHGERLAEHLRRNPEEVWRLASAVKIVDVNARCLEFLGLDSVEQAALSLPEYFDSRSLPVFVDEILAFAGGARSYSGEIQVRNVRGSERDVIISLTVPPGHEESMDRVFVSLVDITERKRTERALQESQERFLQVAAASQEFIWEIDPRGLYTYVSPGAEALLGFKASDLVETRYFYDLHPAGGREEFTASTLDIIQAKLPFSKLVNPLTAKDGSIVWVETSGVPVFGEAGEFLGYRGLDSDVTERERHREERLQSEQRFEKVLKSAMDGFWIVDTNGRIVEVNDASCRMHGYSREELLSLSIADVDSAMDLREIGEKMAQISSEGGARFESRHRRKDGTAIDVEVSVQFQPWEGGRFIAFIRDVTERRRLQEQLLQAQRLEAMGTLSAGIAHDFNNILTPILAHSELALMQLGGNESVRDDIAHVFTAARRAADLVRQVLDLSRREDYQVTVLRLEPLVKEVAKFMRASLPATIEIKTSVDPACGPVVGDLSRVHQVLLNLCTNARDAMLAKGGVLTLSLDHVPEKRVRLTVSDTGEGIRPDLVGRIFEPYFTTKTRGKGTGLGLAMVRSIVDAMGGTITVRSAPGQGTTFEVLLPEGEREDVPEPENAEIPRGNWQRVLLVDDEPDIVGVVEKMCGALGYRATPCTGGVEALEAFRATPERFDAVLTDLTMPKMTGLELAEELVRLRPGLPVLIGTGLAAGLTEDVVRKAGARALLLKPYTARSLGEALNEALGGKA